MTKTFRKEIIRLDEDDLVANVIGSSSQKGNWKTYWINYTGFEWPEKCRIHKCRNKATVGGHMYVKHIKSNKNYWILPLCQACNKSAKIDYGYGWGSVKRGSYIVGLETHDECFY